MVKHSGQLPLLRSIQREARVQAQQDWDLQMQTLDPLAAMERVDDEIANVRRIIELHSRGAPPASPEPDTSRLIDRDAMEPARPRAASIPADGDTAPAYRDVLAKQAETLLPAGGTDGGPPNSTYATAVDEPLATVNGDAAAEDVTMTNATSD
jgi:hypothetical protein